MGLISAFKALAEKFQLYGSCGKASYQQDYLTSCYLFQDYLTSCDNCNQKSAFLQETKAVVTLIHNGGTPELDAAIRVYPLCE